MAERGAAALASSIRQFAEEAAHLLGSMREGTIPDTMGFREWCEALSKRGLKVDKRPFRLDDRPALVPIYDAIPTTRAEARDKLLVVQKATQLGLTVWEVLADIYLCKKFSPISIGLFLPDQNTAAFKSEQRFMPILRSAPELYRELTHRISDNGVSKRIGEGNVLTREIAGSLMLFLWTSGKVSTESRPMDVVSLDEVQEMSLAQIDKVMARVGDSDLAFRMMLSTANMPDLDINFWYKLGTQEVFHTRCDACGVHSDLSDPAGIFPLKSTAYNRGEWERAPAGEYIWTCPACRAWIPDAQQGKYITQNPGCDPQIRSLLMPRTISPKITPRKMVDGFQRSQTGDQKKSFYNRTLARPYIDADQIPVTMAHCMACVADGLAIGLKWETSGRETYMGIDQMGGWNAIIIKRRLPDGRQAVVHVEAVWGEEPFDRCGELMRQYGVSVCVVEQLPNFNSAKRFANRFPGRVFLVATYTNLASDTMVWGDDLTKSDRRTAEDDRTRWTVTINQYKAMQNTLYRVRDRGCLFPDPSLLEQDVMDKGMLKRVPICSEWVFYHYTKTALVVEQDENTRKNVPKVRKIGIDPHFSYASMLCDVAWARNHGTGMMLLPQAPTGEAETDQGARVQAAMPGLPPAIIAMIDSGARPDTCGACYSFKAGLCTERTLRVGAADQACPLFVGKEQ